MEKMVKDYLEGDEAKRVKELKTLIAQSNDKEVINSYKLEYINIIESALNRAKTYISGNEAKKE